MKKQTKIILGVVAATIATGFGIFIAANNKLITLEENVDAQYANIESKLQRRNDLIPNVIAAVKGAMSHEKDIFVEVTEARENVYSAMSASETFEASNKLSGSITKLISIAEAYPEVKSNEQVSDLITELEGSENRISVERDNYNKAVREFNTAIKKFPLSIIAKMNGLEEKEYFKASSGAENVPVVSLD